MTVKSNREIDWGLSRIDAALMAIVIIAISSSGPIIALSTAPVLAMATWRCIFGSIITMPFAIRSAHFRNLTRSQIRLSLASGVALAIHFCLWIPSVRLTSVANSVALVATQPIWMLLMSKRQGFIIPKRAWLGMGIAIMGVLVVVGVDVQVSSTALLGDLMSLASAIAAGAYLNLGGKVRREIDNSTYTAIVYAISAILIGVVAFASDTQLWGFSQRDWLLIFALTFGAQLLGHSLMSRLMSTKSSNVVGIAVLFEPPGAALFAIVLLNQQLHFSALLGMFVILTGLLLVVRQNNGAQKT